MRAGRWGVAAMMAALPLAGVEGGELTPAGDDWEGSMTFRDGEDLYGYIWSGQYCGLPMRCWFRTDTFSKTTPDGLSVVIPGDVAWLTYHIRIGYAVARLTVHVDGEARELAWFAPQHSVCYGTYLGWVARPYQDPALGYAYATKVGPGGDGQWECFPS